MSLYLFILMILLFFEKPLSVPPEPEPGGSITETK